MAKNDKPSTRDVILAELRRIDRTNYWLGVQAELIGGPVRQSTWRYLRGDRSVTETVIEFYLRVLGGRIIFDQKGEASETAEAPKRRRRATAAA